MKNDEKALRDARDQGIRMAAEIASDYDNYSLHDYLMGECILAKLNVLCRRPRKNKYAVLQKKALQACKEYFLMTQEKSQETWKTRDKAYRKFEKAMKRLLGAKQAC